MPNSVLTDPAGVVNGAVADYTTYVASNGADIAYPSTVESWIANGTIRKGDALYFVAPTSTAGVRVAAIPGDSAQSVTLRFAGIAKEAASALDVVRVQRGGICLVNTATSFTKGSGFVGAGTGATPAAGNYAITPAAASNTAGQLTSIAPSSDATAIPGQYYGVFLGAVIGSTNQAPLLIKPL